VDFYGSYLAVVLMIFMEIKFGKLPQKRNSASQQAGSCFHDLEQILRSVISKPLKINSLLIE
jgi:hypothetical protein